MEHFRRAGGQKALRDGRVRRLAAAVLPERVARGDGLHRPGLRVHGDVLIYDQLAAPRRVIVVCGPGEAEETIRRHLTRIAQRGCDHPVGIHRIRAAVQLEIRKPQRRHGAEGVVQRLLRHRVGVVRDGGKLHLGQAASGGGARVHLHGGGLGHRRAVHAVAVPGAERRVQRVHIHKLAGNRVHDHVRRDGDVPECRPAVAVRDVVQLEPDGIGQKPRRVEGAGRGVRRRRIAEVARVAVAAAVGLQAAFVDAEAEGDRAFQPVFEDFSGKPPDAVRLQRDGRAVDPPGLVRRRQPRKPALRLRARLVLADGGESRVVAVEHIAAVGAVIAVDVGDRPVRLAVDRQLPPAVRPAQVPRGPRAVVIARVEIRVIVVHIERLLDRQGEVGEILVHRGRRERRRSHRREKAQSECQGQKTFHSLIPSFHVV